RLAGVRSARHGPERVLRRQGLGAAEHDHLGAERHAVVEVDDVLVEEPDAAARYGAPDAARVRRAVQAIERLLLALVKIERACPERIVEAAFHAVGIGRRGRVAGDHFRRRKPFRPGLLALDGGVAGPGEALPADADAVAHRGPAFLD